MTHACENCRIRGIRAHTSPVMPDWKKEGQIVFMSDYPLEEDLEYARVLSGLHRRALFVHRLIKEAKLDQDMISHATVLRCITASKSIIKRFDYLRCGQHLIEDMRARPSLSLALCFGSIAGGLLTGKDISSIDESRGQVFESVIPGLSCVITYSLGLLTDTRGCGGCGSHVQPFLALKDVMLLKKELKKKNDKKPYKK